MLNRSIRGGQRTAWLFVLILLMVVVTVGYGGPLSAARSSCVDCHLDEDMLEETAAAVVGKGSALQSGAG